MFTRGSRHTATPAVSCPSDQPVRAAYTVEERVFHFFRSCVHMSREVVYGLEDKWLVAIFGRLGTFSLRRTQRMLCLMQ